VKNVSSFDLKKMSEYGQSVFDFGRSTFEKQALHIKRRNNKRIILS